MSETRGQRETRGAAGLISAMAARCPLAEGATAAQLSKRGWESARDGDLQTSLACHKLATENPDANVFAWFYRGSTEQQLGMDAEAKKSFDISVDAKRGPPHLEPAPATEAYFQLGKIARDSGDFAAAERHYLASVRLQPSAPGAHVMLGVTLRDDGRTEEALARYADGLRIQPAIPAAQYNKAQCLLSLGRRVEAIDGFAKAVQIDPSFALAYTALGDELSAQPQHRHDEAIRAYRALAAIEPSSAKAEVSSASNVATPAAAHGQMKC